MIDKISSENKLGEIIFMVPFLSLFSRQFRNNYFELHSLNIFLYRFYFCFISMFIAGRNFSYRAIIRFLHDFIISLIRSSGYYIKLCSLNIYNILNRWIIITFILSITQKKMMKQKI